MRMMLLLIVMAAFGMRDCPGAIAQESLCYICNSNPQVTCPGTLAVGCGATGCFDCKTACGGGGPFPDVSCASNQTGWTICVEGAVSCDTLVATKSTDCACTI